MNDNKVWSVAAIRKAAKLETPTTQMVDYKSEDFPGFIFHAETLTGGVWSHLQGQARGNVADLGRLVAQFQWRELTAPNESGSGYTRQPMENEPYKVPTVGPVPVVLAEVLDVFPTTEMVAFGWFIVNASDLPDLQKVKLAFSEPSEEEPLGSATEGNTNSAGVDPVNADTQSAPPTE